MISLITTWLRAGGEPKTIRNANRGYKRAVLVFPNGSLQPACGTPAKKNEENDMTF